MSDIKRYLVGGAVRDKLLGLNPKDLDYSVVAPSFEAMRDDLVAEGYSIFLDKPEFNIIRAKHPVTKEVADFVLARKEGPYTDNRHPDWTRPGTLLDDLMRRDFTVNAMAQDPETGEVIDYFGGQDDLKGKVLRAVGHPEDRLREDPLRAFRALRFSVVKNFWISPELTKAMQDGELMDLMDHVSVERIREELDKAFASNSGMTMLLLVQDYPRLLKVALDKGLWFKPTTEKR